MVYLNLENLLKKHNRSMYWLSKQMDSSAQNISKLVKNRRDGITFETIDKLCDIFDCEPGDLFMRSKKEE